MFGIGPLQPSMQDVKKSGSFFMWLFHCFWIGHCENTQATGGHLMHTCRHCGQVIEDWS